MNSAIVVIDLQKGLFEEEGRPFEFENTIENINAVTKHARENKIPVIHIQHEQAEGPLKYGGAGWEMVSELDRGENDLKVRKTTPDSFFKTNLKDILDQQKISNLVICGYATEFCIDTTVRRAASLGYSIHLLSDAHTTHNRRHASAERIREHHNQTLSNITSFGVAIKSIKAREYLKNQALR